MIGRRSRKAPAVSSGDQSVMNSTVQGSVIKVGWVGGNLSILADDSPFKLEPVTSGPQDLAPERAQEMPSRLLRAGYEAVPFMGRQPELADLSAWRDQGGQCSVMLVHGPGGQGKTRLLAAFAEASVTAGWAVMRARPATAPEFAPQPDERDTAPDSPGTPLGLLVIVDYAERWRLEYLLSLVSSAPRVRRPARVLLAARPAGRWWQSLQHKLDDMNISTSAMELLPLAQQVDRRELFTAAVQSFADALSVSDAAAITPPPMLDQPEYEMVLTVHMAALAAVDAHQHGDEAPTDPARISAYLLNRERERWRELHERKAIQCTEQLVGQAVFTAILTRPLAYRLGTRALIQAGVVSAAEGAGQLLSDHGFCYPPVDKATVLEPLYPDRLAEDYLALDTPGSGSDDYEPDPWADDAVGELLGADEGQTPPWARGALTVLVAAAERWVHMRQRLYDLLRQAPQLAIDAGGSALIALAELPGIDISVLEAIKAHFPRGQNADLDMGIAAVVACIASHRLEATDDPAEQADIMFTLASRLGNVGYHQDALVAAQFAAETYEDLAANDPAYEPALAKSLNEFGILCPDRWAGLKAIERAEGIYRKLIRADPSTYEPLLARTLTNLGNHHPDPTAALAASQEAVEIYERVARADPAAHESEYAGALSNLAGRLLKHDQEQAALDKAESALAIYRRLVKADPAACRPEIAVVLNNLGVLRLTPEERLAATEEAVQIYRGLAKINVLAYGPRLTILLANLVLRLRELGRGAEALAGSSEAVTQHQRLADLDPVSYDAPLAEQLLGYARLCLAEKAELPAARQAVEQALKIYQLMPYTQPGLQLTDFQQVQCYFVGADVLDALGESEQAERIRKSMTDAGWKPP